MGWKGLPSWLKGGIIAAIIFSPILLVDQIHVSPIVGRSLPLMVSSSIWASLIIISSIIGWIVGKIKSRNNLETEVK